MKTPKPLQRKQIDSAFIEAQAKQIMDSFLKALGKADTPKNYGLRREGADAQTRISKQQEESADPTNDSQQTNPQFRSALFDNARAIDPNKVNSNEEIVMERKKW